MIQKFRATRECVIPIDCQSDPYAFEALLTDNSIQYDARPFAAVCCRWEYRSAVIRRSE
jgi:hypothetical protein